MEITQRIEHIHSQEREVMVRDKRLHHSGSFSGTSSGGRINLLEAITVDQLILHSM